MQNLAHSLPAAITEFYADKNNHNEGISGPLRIHVKEIDSRQQDFELLRFELVPNFVLLLTTAGIINAGAATAREWEDSTIRELLLAPISKTSLIVGKLLSGWITTLLIAAVVLVIGAASGYIRPEDPIYWISTVAIVLLIALASAGDRSSRTPVPEGYSNRYPSTYRSFFPEWWHYCGSVSSSLAADNRSFCSHFLWHPSLEMAIFYNSSEGLVQDVAVHGFTALAATSLGVPSLRDPLIIEYLYIVSHKYLHLIDRHARITCASTPP